MKIMCDTNIILDVLLEREPFFGDSYKVLLLCESRDIDGYITASSITDIFYLIHKYTHSADITYEALGKILKIVNICSVTDSDVDKAYSQRANDFEDCLVSVCAARIGCDYIVTRNLKDFKDFAVSAISPSELLDNINGR